MGVRRGAILASRWVIGEVHNWLPAQVVMIGAVHYFSKNKFSKYIHTTNVTKLSWYNTVLDLFDGKTHPP
ncbi:hypothetical protein [Neobacillus niacini]|uniref:hypothetical protein n=1 Tax=Neobacillus niacini TaxID=86668 RepID=UPI00203E7B14|nr:hypothetical protein [Neobacillus niacini]MCM3689707.1 hypothetical protein [Neobacillus niacini]